MPANVPPGATLWIVDQWVNPRGQSGPVSSKTHMAVGSGLAMTCGIDRGMGYQPMMIRPPR